MSTAFSHLGLAKAMLEAQRFTELSCWTAHNPNQQRAVELVSLADKLLERIPEVNGWASASAEELNQILADHGFDIRLNPWTPGSQFGTVAILDLMVSWAYKGESINAAYGVRPGVPSFLMKDGIRFYDVKSEQPMVELVTQTSDVVRMAMISNPGTDYNLLRAAFRLSMDATPIDSHYEQVMFPKVKLDLSPDISWLLGANLGPWFVSQALMQCKFAMNELGARVKEAAAMAMRKGLSPTLRFDQPFLLWIERPGIPMPISVYYITEEDWRDPGNLSAL